MAAPAEDPDELVEYLLAIGAADPRPTYARLLLLVGPSGSGKTRLATRISAAVASRGGRPGGIVAPRVTAENETVGYDVEDLASGSTRALARVAPPGIPVGRFFLDPDGLSFAEDAITRAMADCDVITVDEVGPLELRGEGHAAAVRALSRWRGGVVLTVRPQLVVPVAATFALDAPRLVSLDR